MRESASFVSKQLQSTAPISTWPPAILAMSEVVSPPSATLPLTPAHSKLLLRACVTDNGLNYWEIWLTEKNLFQLSLDEGRAHWKTTICSRIHTYRLDWSSQLWRILLIETIHYWIITLWFVGYQLWGVCWSSPSNCEITEAGVPSCGTRVSSLLIHLFSLH